MSKSVRFSINRYLDIKIWWSSDGIIKNITKFPIRISAKIYRHFLFFFLSSFIGKAYLKNFEIKIADNQKISNNIKKIEPSLLLYPLKAKILLFCIVKSFKILKS